MLRDFYITLCLFARLRDPKCIFKSDYKNH